jgi:hypothetical protein
MSNIQNRASGFLKTMLSGRPVRLNAEAQGWIAAWAFMTLCTWEYTLERQYIPESHRHELFHRRTEPPKGFKLWIGAHGARRGERFRLATCFVLPFDARADIEGSLPSDAQGYAATMQFRQVVLQGFGHNIDGADFGVQRGEADLYFADLWPVRTDPLTWPGRFALDEAGLESASLAWYQNPWRNI